MKWIPVKERLPEGIEFMGGVHPFSPNLLFVAEDDLVLHGYYDTNIKCFIDLSEQDNSYKVEEVSHWIPLPKPPKE